MFGLLLLFAVCSIGNATHFITKVNETVHHNVVLKNNEAWNPEMYAKKIIFRNLTGEITPKSFSLLTKVEEIYFAHSSISNIHHNAFGSNPRLKTLQFSYNEYLPEITNEVLRNCRNLRKFSMGHNKKIEGISDYLFSNLHNLTHVEITKENKLPKRITKAFFNNSKSLESVKLHFSNITAIDSDAFENLDRLQFLSLVENEIVEIGAGAFKSPNLIQIYLGWNKLTSFTGEELSSLRNLRTLDISFNPLKRIDLEQITHAAPKLKNLLLMRTSLNCDEKRSIKMKESTYLAIGMDLMELEKCDARR
ncbi:chaoptin-like [Coccinella septempunctata]|uniref:chaoptin-like n=1 Tax=Coccinella septempunctata TaxID=41139 RepID=UPI001D077305|nr:chaoptin-like [Coccinella septempunctata]XP_044746577.1 chaoptin-like [Coccinella septempunctata]